MGSPFLLLAGFAKFFLSPENHVFFCSLLLILWPWMPKRGSRNWRIVGGASLVWIVVLFSPLGSLGLYHLERAYPIPTPEELRGKTALVLGGNTVLYDTIKKQMDWRSDSARVQEPLRLYHQGLLTRLVITAGSVGPPPEGYLPEAASIAKWWQELGVPQSAIAVEDTARNTRENFERVRPLLRPGEQVVLFTSAYHLRRSMAVARKALQNSVIPYPVDFKVDGYEWWSWSNVINARKLLFELFGLLAYRLAGFSS